MKYLIVGLGNPGIKYTETRHNIGFKILDAFAQASNTFFSTDRYGDVASVKYKGREFVLLKPSTYMNLSRKAVNYWLQKEKIPVENMLVIVDDIALPLGTIRIRAKGSDGGHNGLLSIASTLGHMNYARMRFGIGGDFPQGMQADYVLSEWTREERNALPARIDIAADAIKAFGTIGLERTMNTFNKKTIEPTPIQEKPKAENPTPEIPQESTGSNSKGVWQKLWKR